jgi:hypothetical protein
MSNLFIEAHMWAFKGPISLGVAFQICTIELLSHNFLGIKEEKHTGIICK